MVDPSPYPNTNPDHYIFGNSNRLKCQNVQETDQITILSATGQNVMFKTDQIIILSATGQMFIICVCPKMFRGHDNTKQFQVIIP